MKYIFIFLLLPLFSYGAVDGPPASPQTILDDKLNRTAHFGLILNYLEQQAIYDIVEHYSYLQNRDKTSLTLTKRQRRDLMKYIDIYYKVLKTKYVQTPVKVTCQAPQQQ